jgi:hypothetical protein
VNGWSITTYDNHDRDKVLLQGEKNLKIEDISHIPARVHHILSHTSTTEDTLNALYTLTPQIRGKLFSMKIVYSRPSNYGSKNYCVALSGPPLGLNDYSLAPPTRRLQTNRTTSING